MCPEWLKEESSSASNSWKFHAISLSIVILKLFSNNISIHLEVFLLFFTFLNYFLFTRPTWSQEAATMTNFQIKERPPAEGRRSTPNQPYFSVLNWQARNICMYEPRTDKVSHNTQQNYSCGISQLSALIWTETYALETPPVNSKLWQCQYLYIYSMLTLSGEEERKEKKKRLDFTNVGCFN